ncbi:hypothetical protein M770_25810 [Pseudomonas aeruginosa VRFPA03]|nr:hypothetical protein M770_25810 [Pseudomonas aeruginosa VRFPA03]
MARQVDRQRPGGGTGGGVLDHAPRQGRAQGQDVAGADQRRTAAQVRLHVAQARRIAPFGLLQRFAAPYALQ